MIVKLPWLFTGVFSLCMLSLFYTPKLLNSYVEPLIDKCQKNGTLPFWSRGFARACCDVYPTSFVKHERGFFEAGGLSDSTYFPKRSAKSGDVLYVAIADFPVFLQTFHRFDSSMRITLVTGAEDIGAPWEIFHPTRNFFDYTMSALWPKGQLMTMRQFISDPRLVRWYAQNYDLVGNTSFTTSDMNVLADKELIAKVFPLPIGLDFHTLAEKNQQLSQQQVLDSVCDQRRELSAVVSKALPFTQRLPQIYAMFECDFKKNQRMRIITRGAICALLAFDQKNSTGHIIFADSIKNKKDHNLSSQESKLLFWRQVSEVQFVIAPAGMGTDTHRVWEILNLHSIPVVMSSPLDGLYEMFPVIIVKKWSEVFQQNAVSKFSAAIKEKFGEEPFKDSVLKMLQADYWVNEIRNASASRSR